MTKDTLRERLNETNEKHFMENLRNMDDTFNNLFYKVNRKISKEILEEDDIKAKEYVGELLYHQSEFYEQLLVNLGIEFKLRAYQLHKNDYSIGKSETDIGNTILNEFEQRVSFVMSNPFLDLYYRLEYGEEEDSSREGFSKLVMKVVKRYIKEILKMVFYDVRGMVRREMVDKDNRDTLAFVYHGYYLQYMDSAIIDILEEVFEAIKEKDQPYTEEEENIYDLLSNLAYCLCSPKSDPLKVYYG